MRKGIVNKHLLMTLVVLLAIFCKLILSNLGTASAANGGTYAVYKGTGSANGVDGTDNGGVGESNGTGESNGADESNGTGESDGSDGTDGEDVVIDPETISLSILATGDLHGQANPFNYETELPYATRGLTKVATLIAQARKEKKASNCVLVDAGDFLYDYSTNFFYDNYPDTIQPIMQIMGELGYDCITLGNHELDYPWEYITRQLRESKLYDKVVVGNLNHVDSGESVFAPSMIIRKMAVTSEGNKVRVSIGVVGATRRSLSARREYYGFLTSEDIYASVSKEAKRLKDGGDVDIVIALVHGGIGVLSGSDTSVQAGARLAKLKYVDGVVTSHTHEIFPLNDGTYADAAYKGIVNEELGLVHGTPVVGTGTQAEALGLINITLALEEDGTKKVINANSEVRKVAAKTKEVAAYSELFARYLDILLEASDDTEYPIAKGRVYTNLDCFIQDNDLFQLYNNAKIQFGYNYVSEYHPEYLKLPIIACTGNVLDNGETEVYIKDAFTRSNISGFRSEQTSFRDNGYLSIYKISGWQLREWLEYNASIYATVGAYTLEGAIPSYHKKNPDILPLLQSAYYERHSMFYIFDGIEYTIDITQRARYYGNGSMIASGNRRITSLTYNGVNIKDNQDILIVADAFDTRTSVMPTDSQRIITVNPWICGKDALLDYVRQLSVTGPINVVADNNWKIVAPNDYRFAIGLPFYITDLVKDKAWYTKYAVINRDFKVYPVYFVGSFNKTAKLRQGLNVVLSKSKTSQTAFDVDILVHASVDTSKGDSEDESTTAYAKAEIVFMKYLKGIYRTTTNKAWDDAPEIAGNRFTVTANGNYTVLVMDSLGNKSLQTINISNINRKVLDAPRFDTYTNRLENLTGTSVPYSNIIVELPDGSMYIGDADENGVFDIMLPMQKGFEKISAYAVFDGIRSKPVEVMVRRTGPDMPVVVSETFYTTNEFSGYVDPYSTVYLRYGTTVYVNYGEIDIYKACDFYNASYTVVETDITIVPLDDGRAYFIAALPRKIPVDKSVYVYAIDKNKKSSKGLKLTIGIQ